MILAGTITTMLVVLALVSSDALVTSNTRSTTVSSLGGTIVPSSAITLVELDVLIAIVYPAGTTGSVNFVASFAGAAIVVRVAAISAAVGETSALRGMS
ncbi:hypothetical protein D3C78_1477150 [compost metagenome]